MKVALLLRGITYKDIYIHHTGKILKIDYREYMDKINSQIIEPLRAKYDVDLFLVTYKSNLDQIEILKDFEPYVDTYFMDEIGPTQTDCLLTGLRMIYRHLEDKKFIQTKYDLIIVSRMDLDLLMNINDIEYNGNKFNFLWNEITKDGQVADCMYFLNPSFLLPFISALNAYTKTKYCRSLHFIRPYIERYIDKKDINIIFTDYWDSNTDFRPNPLYKIIRQEVELPKQPEPPSFYKKFLGNPTKFRIR